MSSDHYRRQIAQKRDQVLRLQKDKSKAVEKAAQARKKSVDARSAASRTKTPSTMKSKLSEAERQDKEAARQDKLAADAEKKIGLKEKDIGNLEASLKRELDREERKRVQGEQRRQKEHERTMRSISSKLTTHDELHRETDRRIAKLSELPEKIVVLFLASNPLDSESLRLDEEARSISEMIRKAKHRDAVKLESCWAVRALDVLQAINEHSPRIVHFSGHGSEDDEIIFQDNDGNAKPVSMDAIVQTMVSTSDRIQLVYFNTCHSHNQAEAVANKVGAAIGMSTSVSDDAARVFCAQFYSAIGFGLSLRQAFDQGKAALMLEGIPEEDTPQLFVAAGLDPDRVHLVRPAGVSKDADAAS